MALLRLAAQWRDQSRLTVLTVDHSLRAESKQEARQVAEWSAQAGVTHVTLPWNSAKPQTGIQAKARAARYDLMSEWCRSNDVPVLLTAHTLDDQAETVLMRLARTTSLDSLAGIHRFGRWNGTELFRPLLSARREDLRAYLSSLGQGWMDDASNDDDRFERVRVRKAMAGLQDVGITAEGLAELAWRANEAVEALWSATGDWVKLHVQEFETGHCVVPLEAFIAQTKVLQARILGCLICRFGSGKMPEPRELDLLSAWVEGAGTRRTLGGAIIARRKDYLLIGREPARIDATPVPVPPIGVMLWDGRFEVHSEPGNRVIPALCAGHLHRCKKIPWFVQAGLPAIVRGKEILGVPLLGMGFGAKAVFRPRLALTSRLH